MNARLMWTLSATVWLGVALASAQADDASQSPDTEGGLQPIPDEPALGTILQDVAYERYVDIHQLGPAWLSMDASALTDIGLQLAEGERILLRPHTSQIPSAKVLQLAAQAAIQQRDRDGLARLKRAAQQQKLSDLEALISAAEATIDSPRSLDSEIDKVRDSLSESDLAVIEANADTILALQAVGDSAALDSFAEAIPTLDASEAAKQVLQKLLASAKESVAAPEPEFAESLKLLMDSARGEESNRNEVRARVAAGGWTVVWGVNINEAEYLKFLAAAAASFASGNPAALERYFSDLLQRNIDKLKKGLTASLQAEIQKRALEAIKTGRTFTIGKIAVKGGLATYQRWNVVIYDEPRTKTCYKTVLGKKIPYPCTYMERVEKKIPLPNHHTPYFAYKF